MTVMQVFLVPSGLNRHLKAAVNVKDPGSAITMLSVNQMMKSSRYRIVIACGILKMVLLFLLHASILVTIHKEYTIIVLIALKITLSSIN